MKQNKIFAILISVAILVGSCSRKDTDFTKLSTNLQVRGTITGKVVAKDGKGIPGVAVIADDGTMTTSGIDGSYVLNGRSTGEHSITYFKENYIDTTIAATVHLMKASAVNVIKLRSRFSTISGIIADEAGVQITPGATVAGVGIEGQAANKFSFDGTFKLEKVEAGDLQFMAVVSGKGFGILRKEIQPDSSYSDVTIKISGVGGTVKGTIQQYDNTGKLVPVLNANVTMLSGLISDTTNEKGEFSLNHIPSNSELTLFVQKVSGKDTLSASVGGVSCYEKGSKSIGTVIITPNKKDGVYAYNDGFYVSELLPVMKLNVQSPVKVIDTAYAAYRYQWDVNGDDIWDTITSSSRISIGKQTNWIEGEFKAYMRLISVIKSSGARDTSGRGTITLSLKKSTEYIPPKIRQDPKDTTLLEIGKKYSIKVIAEGSEALSYNWFKNDTLIPGEKNDSLIIDPVSASSSGNYHCIVWDTRGRSDTSTIATLIVRGAQRVIFGDTLFEVIDQSYWFGKKVIRYLPTVDMSWGKYHVDNKKPYEYYLYWPDTTFADTTVMIWGDTATPYGDEVFQLTPGQSLLYWNEYGPTYGTDTIIIPNDMTTNSYTRKIGNRPERTFTLYTSKKSDLVAVEDIYSSSGGGQTQVYYYDFYTSSPNVPNEWTNVITAQKPTIITAKQINDTGFNSRDTIEFEIDASGFKPMTYTIEGGNSIPCSKYNQLDTPMKLKKVVDVDDTVHFIEFRIIVANVHGIDTTFVSVDRKKEKIKLIDSISGNRPIKVGDSLKLVAHLKQGVDSIRWYDEENPKIGIGNTDTLIFIPNEFNDSIERFRCVATFGKVIDTQTVVIAISDTISKPEITEQSEDNNGSVGDSVSLWITATGNKLSYQWYKDTAAVPGATSSELIFNPLKVENAGRYRCKVYNSAGDTLSDYVMVTVLGAPEITIHPQTAVAKGYIPGVKYPTVTYSITAIGENLKYEWYRIDESNQSDVKLVGSDSPTLTFKVTDADFAYSFYCVVSNSVGMRKSSFAALKY